MTNTRPKKKRWKKRRASEHQEREQALVMTGEQVAITCALLARQECTFYVVSTGHNTFWMICDNGFDILTAAFDRAVEVLATELQGLNIKGAL